MPQRQMQVLWWSEERTSDSTRKFSSQTINYCMLAHVSMSRRYHRIHDPISSPWYLGFETFSAFFYVFEISAITRDICMRWNNRKLRRVFPVSVVKAITLSTSQRLLYADYTVRLSSAAFCNLENWVHRYTTEAHATNKICTLFLNRLFHTNGLQNAVYLL
jgi:hypothetical protein